MQINSRYAAGGLARLVRLAGALGLIAGLAACRAPTASPAAPTPTQPASLTPDVPTATSPAPTPTAPATPEPAPPTATATLEPEPYATAPVPSPTASLPAAGGGATATAVPYSIEFFSVSPAVIEAGDPVTLTWAAAGEQVVIYRLDALGRLTLPAYYVPLAGTLVITTETTLRNQVAFVLFAISGAASVQAGAYALIACTTEWFFTPAPEQCPAASPVETALVAQDFEHGQMIWLGASRLIYILHAGGARWEVRSDSWGDGMPVDDPALVPPPGLLQPVRGFGLVWRDEAAPAGARLRDRLGWAVNEEYALGTGSFQCDSAPRYPVCYLSGPGGSVLVLQPEGSGWSVWTGG